MKVFKSRKKSLRSNQLKILKPLNKKIPEIPLWEKIKYAHKYYTKIKNQYLNKEYIKQKELK